MTHCTERARNQARPRQKAVTPTDLKSSPGFGVRVRVFFFFFADLQKAREPEKERDKRGRVERCKFY